MRKIKLLMILIVAVFVTQASLAKPAKPDFYHNYAVRYYNAAFGEYEIIMDLTAANWTEGIDYECLAENSWCVVAADPSAVYTRGPYQVISVFDGLPVQSGKFSIVELN